MAEAIDLFVDRRIFVDICIGLFDVRFGLIIVVIRNEILDSVIGEQRAELLVELRGERFVVGDDEGGELDVFDDPGDRIGLTRTGNAEEGLLFHAIGIPSCELLDRRGLITGGIEWSVDFERSVRLGMVWLERTGISVTHGEDPWRWYYFTGSFCATSEPDGTGNNYSGCRSETHMNTERLRDASDVLRDVSEDVQDDEIRNRLCEQADQLRALAARDRAPDHGRLARHQHVLRELGEQCGSISEPQEDINDVITSIREEIEGI